MVGLRVGVVVGRVVGSSVGLREGAADGIIDEDGEVVGAITKIEVIKRINNN